jgi:hypothetical protein
MQRIRLIRKLASRLNGVDLSKFLVSDVLLVPESTAEMLIREGWAELVRGESVMPEGTKKVCIVHQPTGMVQGLSLRDYRIGHVYDLPASVAAQLVMEGFAFVEMRRETRPLHHPDRRRKPE